MKPLDAKPAKSGRSAAMIQSIKTLLFMGVVACGALVAAQDVLLSSGRITDKVVIKDEPSQSYALYLPSSFDPAKKFPIVYCFDPGARGSTAVEKYRAAAEKYGYIAVGSNNSRNGIDLRLLSNVLNNLWADTNQRFPIDTNRTLAAGLSGGARVASLFANSCKGCIFGVIGSVAGPSPDIEISEKLPFIFFGTVGLEDVNFVEFRELEKKLTAAHIAHRIEEFDGGHQWLDESLAAEALGWFELRAMKAGRRPVDKVMIEEQFQARTAGADQNLAERMFLEAYTSLIAIADDFEGWRDVSAVRQKARSLASSAEYKRAQGSDAAQLLAQQKAAGEINSLRATIGNLSLENDPKMLIREKIATLHKKADAAADSPDRRVARRVLNQLFIESIESANYRGDRSSEIYRALETLEIAVAANPKNAQVHFNRARLYCGLGKKKEAIDELSKAVELGFKDADRIKAEKAFEILETDERFIKLVAGLK